MNTKATLLAAVGSATLLLGAPALAQNKSARISLGVTAGSLGIGPEVGIRVAPILGLRASASFLDLTHDVDVNDITYNGKLKLENYGANADLYPFGGGFRVSGGFRIDKNRVRVESTPTSNVTVGDTSFTPAQIGTLSGNITAEDFAPTLTIGYAGGLTKGIKFGIDAGAMFQGKPRVTDLKATGSLSTNPTFIAELAKEQQKIDDQVNKYQVFPVLQLSLFYAF